MENKIIIAGTKNKAFLLFDLPLGGAAGPELTGYGNCYRDPGGMISIINCINIVFLGTAPAICCNLLHTSEANVKAKPAITDRF